MPLLLLLGQNAVGVTLGDTSQLGAITSTGGITLERTIGGTSQLGAISSTGGITRERVIGGTSQLEAFSSTGTIQAGVEQTRGASLPPKLVKTKLRKKDESILEEVYKLIAISDEVDPPKQIKERIEKVEVRAKKAINIQPAIQHEKEIRNTKQQIDRIELSLKKYITEVKEDEDAAIRALLEVI